MPPIETYEQDLDLDNPGRPIETYLDDTDDDDEVEMELEVVDDTPPADRNRDPLPEDIKKNLDADDDVEEYSDKVKQRIAQMKKAWHDERRAKEAAMREREEAVRVAQTAYQERQQYQKYLEENEQWAMGHAQERAKMVLEQAKREYRDAYESGDTDRIVEAQTALQRASNTVDQLLAYKPQPYAQQTVQQPPLQPQQNDVYNQQRQPPPVDDRAKQWAAKNRWFMQDPEMTNFALGVHQKLVQDGISADTDEYYNRLDARIRQVFPDKFKGKKAPAGVVAPVGRSARSTKVTLTRSQVAVAKRLGITPEQYAKELARMGDSA